MNWKSKHYNLGEIKVGIKKEIIFTPTEDLKEINNMTSSCGCSLPKLIGNTIVVIYTPGSIPTHLISIGKYDTTKTITINYKDNSQDILSFSATIKK